MRLIKAMKSRITALNQFNRRERLRKKFALYLLLILLSVFVFEEGIAIVGQNREVYIENAQASALSVKIPEEKVADSPASKASEVLNTSASEIPQESSSQLSLEDKILQAFNGDVEMVQIAKAESRLNPMAYNENRNGTIDVGIFQINSTWGYSKEYLENVDNNIAVAKKVLDKQGKTAWAVYNYAQRNNLSI